MASSSKSGNKRKASATSAAASSTDNLSAAAAAAAASEGHRSTGSESGSPSKKRRQSSHSRASKPVEYEEPESEERDEESAMPEWSPQDLVQLIHNVELQLPKPDKGKYSTQVQKIEWDKVYVAGREPEECKSKWYEVMTKVRRFRTLTELVEDAKEWVKQPWTAFSINKKVKHPDLPKKPLTPYFRFFMEKRKRLSQDRPDLSMTELAKLLAKKYAEMPLKKKQKYKDNYERENEEYKVLLTKFKKEHPDLYPETDAPSRSNRLLKHNAGPAKPQTASQLFMASKMNKHNNVDPSEKKEYEEKYRGQWKNLSNQKRVKWIRKAMATEQQYTLELAQYCLEKPGYKYDAVKPVITKAEKAILDRFDGKPTKPPNSGYSLYSRIMLKEITDIPSKEKMTEISRRWKEMSEKERESYAKQVVDATEKYNREYEKYLDSLNEEDRRKLIELDKKGKKRSANKSNSSGSVGGAAEDAPAARGQSKPKKPLSALFLYQQEKLPAYKEKHPDKSEQEVTRHLAREFGELSDKKKDKYKKLADEARKENAAANQNKADAWKGKLFKGEPKKPPQSGYLIFTTELIGKLVTVEPKSRMGEISRRWKALSTAEQDKFKKKAADLTRKYNREHAKFIENLSADDRQLYLQQKAKKGSGGTPSKGNVAMRNVKVETQQANEEDASSDEEKDDDDSESESGDSKSNDSSDDDDDDDSDKSDSDSGSHDSDGSNSSSSGSGTKASSDSSSKSGSDDDDDDDDDGSGSDSDSGSDK